MYLPTLDGQVLTPAQTILLLDDDQLRGLLTDLDRVSLGLLSAPREDEDLEVTAWRGSAGIISVLALRSAQEATRRGLKHELMNRFVVRQFMLVRTPSTAKGDTYDLPSWWHDEASHRLLASGELPVQGLDWSTVASASGPWSTSTATWWRHLGDDLYVDESNGRPLENSLRVSTHRQHIFEGGPLDGQERTLDQVLSAKSTDPSVLGQYELVGVSLSDELFAQSLCTWKVRAASA